MLDMSQTWVGISGQAVGAVPDFSGIEGWGVLFGGYAGGERPEGVLRLDDFAIGARPSDAPITTGIDQTIAFNEDAAVVALEPISISSPPDGSSIAVTLRLSDPLAGTLTGAGHSVGGLYSIVGSAAEVNAALNAMTFVPASDYDRPLQIEIGVRAGTAASPTVVGNISLVPTPAADAPVVANLNQTIEYASTQFAVGLGNLSVSDPDSDAQIEVLLTVPVGMGTLLGRVEQVAEGYRLSGTVAEVNARLATLSFIPSIVATQPITIGVTVSDGTGSPISGTISMIRQENAPPDAINVVEGALTIAENSPAGTHVATVLGSDSDGGPLRYSLLDDGDGRFRIDQQGRISVADSYRLDHESASEASIVVRVSDTFGFSLDQAFIIAITDQVGELIVGDMRGNVLRGGTGNDDLRAYVGPDTLIGGTGDDTYIILTRQAVVVEAPGEGNDAIYAGVSYTLALGVSVETLRALDLADTAPLNFGGNEFDNSITGNAGRNILSGGDGNDILSGGAGADVFVFDTALDADHNVDQILDFVSGEDRIRLDSRIFTGLENGALPSSAFVIGPAATEAGHRIIFDPATGVLSFDVDGVGGLQAVAFATVGAGNIVTASDFEVVKPLTAADLSPGQFIVDGQPDYSPSGFGDVAARLLANIPGAVEMRFGNTQGELALADWQGYAPTSDWILRTGVGEQTVHAEFRLADGSIVATNALIPPYMPDGEFDHMLPPSDAVQLGNADETIWKQDFSSGSDRWKAYDYDGGSLGVGNVFYPASWSPTGGADGSGYIYADDSRWIIDTPEDPHSILALLTYPRWIDSSTPFGLDLTDTTIEFYLKGEDLDLKGGQAYFWVVDSSGRWKNYAQELVVGNGEWAFNTVNLSSLKLEDWSKSFSSAGGDTINLASIHSWGIAFVGFDQGAEPTGKIALDEFVIRRTTAIAMENADQLLLATDNGDVAIAPLIVTGPSSAARVTVTLTLNDNSLGFLEGAGSGVDGVYTITGTVKEVNAALESLVFRPSGTDPMVATVTVRASTGEAGVISAPHNLTIVRQGEIVGTPDNDYLVGTVLNDVIRGNAGADRMIGGRGDDSYYVDNAGDYVIEAPGEGYDRVFASASYTLYPGQSIEVLSTDNNFGTAAINLAGNELDNIIYGNAGNNILDGRDGNDYMMGLAGDDHYYVDSAGDIVIEAPGEGYDRVFASVSYTLYPGQSIEILSTNNHFGTAPINLAGNELDNVIYGNAGNNILDGRGGNDYMMGLAGDDSYYVDSAGDIVIEAPGEGYDRVFASVSYALHSGQSIEVLSTTSNFGTAPINLTGNELDNIIYGNAGNNILDGRGGNDYMMGLAGDDSYYVDSAGDYVVEAPGEGFDRVFASVDYTLYPGQSIEVLSTTNSFGTAPINLGGNELDNIIYGNAGNNILYGKGGNDTLLGGDGDDQFWFTDALGPDNVDTILDFTVGSDKLVLFSGVFAGLTAGGLAASAFVTGTSAQDADDRILYDPLTGSLYFDADGNGDGVAVQFATLQPGLALGAGDILIF